MSLIKDVAEKAGVSASTVSLVINNKPGISAQTRERVLATMQELGYVKERTPRSASRQKAQSIQFVLYKKHGLVVADTPFFTHLLEGVETQVKKYGFNLLVSYINEKQGVDAQLQSILHSGCSGLLLLATEMTAKDMQPFLHAGVPVVVLDSYFEEAAVDTVVINNKQGAYLATCHLGEMGNKTIGYLQSSVPINNFYERKDGYKKALKCLRIPYNKEYVFRLGASVDTAYSDMKALLQAGCRLPQAFFADNDVIAMGAIKALREAGVSIPAEVSIVGFDDVPMCEMLDPPLTTIRVPKQYIGMLAVDRLAARMDSLNSVPVKIEVRTELIKRGSVQSR